MPILVWVSCLARKRGAQVFANGHFCWILFWPCQFCRRCEDSLFNRCQIQNAIKRPRVFKTLFFPLPSYGGQLIQFWAVSDCCVLQILHARCPCNSSCFSSMKCHLWPCWTWKRPSYNCSYLCYVNSEARFKVLRKRDGRFTKVIKFQNLEECKKPDAKRHDVTDNILRRDDRFDGALRELSTFVMNHLQNTLRN